MGRVQRLNATLNNILKKQLTTKHAGLLQYRMFVDYNKKPIEEACGQVVVLDSHGGTATNN